MHALYRKADTLSQVAIGSAMQFDRLQGPGLMESLLSPCACIGTMNPIGQFHVAYATRICPSAFRGSWKGLTSFPIRLSAFLPADQPRWRRNPRFYPRGGRLFHEWRNHQMC